jgi:hypothetical protein
MSEDNKYGIEDLISNAVLQKPMEFQSAFNNIVIDRIRDAVENKKIEVAQQLYNYNPDEANDSEELDNSEE